MSDVKVAMCRYNNSPMAELQCAAQQEAKIIQHRLQYLLESKGHAAGRQSPGAAVQRTGACPTPLPPQIYQY